MTSSIDDRFIRTAGEAAHWLHHVAVNIQDGVCWPAAPGVTPLRRDPSFYYGAAGIVTFLATIFQVTRQERDLGLARHGACGILAQAEKLPAGLVWRAFWKSNARDAGFYSGGGGISLALLHLYQVCGEMRFLKAASDGAKAVANFWTRQGGYRLVGATDISNGAAGAGLCLLYAARFNAINHCADAAALIGEKLLDVAIHERQGIWWSEVYGDSVRTHFPNFSHGTAGVAYFLAQLYVFTKEERFLEGARQGAVWLLSNAVRGGHGLRWHHNDDYGRQLFYSGWCHGPAGTARLFYLLYKITGEESWRRATRQCASAVKHDLENGSPGLWNLSMCCGVAGIGDFFASLYLAFGDEEYLDTALGCGDMLIDEALRTPEGTRWIQAEFRAHPNIRLAQTGFSQGVAGIGLFLVRLHCIGRECLRVPRMPDDPFPPA